MSRMIAAALLLLGLAPELATGLEWNGYARRIGIFSSAGYHVYDACPECHTRHTGLAHQVDGWYYGGHPKYQLHSPNAGFYSTQWCQIAPFGPSYAGLHNYTSSAPYRGVYPLSNCANCAPEWSDVEQLEMQGTPVETVEPGSSEPQKAEPAKEPAVKPTARKRTNSRYSQTSTQAPVRPVR
ncbi:MAG: hypothetical protein JNG90_16095 [Planctomycetaceae bacterium]|nr:hypothetical protein [Planctomycetaceae bacterium]